jgi:hypothetical protein
VATLFEQLWQLKRSPVSWFAAGAVLVVLVHLMGENVTTAIAQWVLAFAWALGGLAVWPVYRWRQPHRVTRLRWLKAIFVFHVVGTVATVPYVVWAHVEDIGDAYGTALFFYLIGTLSLIASALVQIAGKLGTLGATHSARSR